MFDEKAYNKKYGKKYRKKNKKRIREYNRKYRKKYRRSPKGKEARRRYYKNHREEILEQRKTYREKTPWAKHLEHARKRCNYKHHKSYKYYGAKDIELCLTFQEVKKLWFRDKAYLMDKPSINRKDPKGHYEYDNCEFIELSENSSKARKKK